MKNKFEIVESTAPGDAFAVVTEMGGKPIVTSAATKTTTVGASSLAKPFAAEAAPTENKAPVIDEYHGRGGSYVMDTETQTRRPNKE